MAVDFAISKQATRILAISDSKQRENEIAVWFVEEFLEEIKVIQFKRLSPDALVRYENMPLIEREKVGAKFFQQPAVAEYLKAAESSEKPNKNNYEWLCELSQMIDRQKYFEYYKRILKKMSEFESHFSTTSLVFICFSTRWHVEKEIKSRIKNLDDSERYFQNQTPEQKKAKQWFDSKN